jgi:osmoprotectant transport system permease protein
MTRSLASDVFGLTLEHVWLVGISVALAVALAVPGGVILTRRARLRRWLLGFANVVQTIPSLAVFGLLLPVPLISGVGKRTAIVALVLYALLPVLRNTLVGILGIDPAVRESAVAMGMTEWQLLFQVEMPLAVPTILADIRIAVTTIGTATIAAVIGGGGLGFSSFVESRWMQHKSRRRDSCCGDGVAGGRGLGMGRAQIVACLMLLLASGCSRQPRIVVGSKNFTEQIILGEILAQQLERRTKLIVHRKFNLGGTLLTQEALVSGALDLYRAYTGTALTAILKNSLPRTQTLSFGG